jgi:hypothetical protein
MLDYLIEQYRRPKALYKRLTCSQLRDPSPGGVAQLVERVLYHSTRRAVPDRSWVQSLLPTTEVEPGISTFGGMLVPVLQLISPVCKTGTSLFARSSGPQSRRTVPSTPAARAVARLQTPPLSRCRRSREPGHVAESSPKRPPT